MDSYFAESDLDAEMAIWADGFHPHMVAHGVRINLVTLPRPHYSKTHYSPKDHSQVPSGFLAGPIPDTLCRQDDFRGQGGGFCTPQFRSLLGRSHATVCGCIPVDQFQVGSLAVDLCNCSARARGSTHLRHDSHCEPVLYQDRQGQGSQP